MNIKNSPAVILVPGYWLGSWAWDDVTGCLFDAGVPTMAVTLPGLDSPATRRHNIRLSDHIEALVKTISNTASPVLLVAHSGAGALATAVLDEVPELISRVVYVESGPVADRTIARPDLDTETVEVPLPTWEQLEAGGASLAGLNEVMLRRFQAQAVPHPAGPLREPVRLNNPARNNVPATIVCCSCPSTTVRQMAVGGTSMFAPLVDLTDTDYVDLPTGHWPMWSKPEALSEIIMAELMKNS